MPYSVQLEDFEEIESEWERILPDTFANTIFVTPWWQKVWWKHFGQSANLQILSVRHDYDIIGIAPLMLNDGVLSFLGDTDLFDYHDFLVINGRESEFYNALCEYIVEMDWQSMELKSLREGSPTLEHIKTLAEAKGYKVEIEHEDVSPFVTLPPTWDDHVATLRKKDRHELRRKLRRLDRDSEAKQYACDVPADHMDEFFTLMRASRDDKDDFLTPEREEFFKKLAVELSSRDQFKLYFLEVDDVRVASCICFDYAGKYLLYNSGYNPEYSPLSVGLLNKALCLKDAIEEGRETFDFLRGDERYKYDLGGHDQSVYQMVVHR